jgi:hypothetical protein
VAFHILYNGVAADTTDEYVCIRECTIVERMRRLVLSVVEHFEDEYLRAPNHVLMAHWLVP